MENKIKLQPKGLFVVGVGGMENISTLYGKLLASIVLILFIGSKIQLFFKYLYPLRKTLTSNS